MLSVPDEGYFERTWWKAILSVPDEGYSSIPDEGYSSIPDEGLGYSSNVPDEGYSRNALCALSLISMFLLIKCDYKIYLSS